MRHDNRFTLFPPATNTGRLLSGLTNLKDSNETTLTCPLGRRLHLGTSSAQLLAKLSLV